MAWAWRGMREGIVTTPYPRRADGYGQDFRGMVTVRPGDVEGLDAPVGAADRDLTTLCPTRAITVEPGASPKNRVRLDRGRCILCGRCIKERPDLFMFEASFEVGDVARGALVVPVGDEDDTKREQLRGALHRRVRALRRSIHIRHVDAGSDGSEEWEVAALGNPVYDIQRLGIYFTATPRHADLLLVTGAGTAGMVGSLRRTFDAMPDPKVVIATGTDAVSAGLIRPTYAVGEGVDHVVPVDVWIPGSPPSPFSILHGILLGIGLLRDPRGLR